MNANAQQIIGLVPKGLHSKHSNKEQVGLKKACDAAFSIVVACSGVSSCDLR